jgi:hypothetical protein
MIAGLANSEWTGPECRSRPEGSQARVQDAAPVFCSPLVAAKTVSTRVDQVVPANVMRNQRAASEVQSESSA